MHWALLVIYIQEEKICFYDSIRNSALASRYLNGAIRWIKDVANDLQIDVFINRWITEESPVDLPQQDDSYACGVFVCAFANLLTDDIPLIRFQQSHENSFRRKL